MTCLFRGPLENGITAERFDAPCSPITEQTDIVAWFEWDGISF